MNIIELFFGIFIGILLFGLLIYLIFLNREVDKAQIKHNMSISNGVKKMLISNVWLLVASLIIIAFIIVLAAVPLFF